MNGNHGRIHRKNCVCFYAAVEHKGVVCGFKHVCTVVREIIGDGVVLIADPIFSGFC